MDEARLRYLAALAEATGADGFRMPEIQTGEALVESVAPEALRSVLYALYAERVTAHALRWGDVEAVVDALQWRYANAPMLALADTLSERRRRAARQRGEPVWVPVSRPEPTTLPTSVLTKDGLISLEDAYLPRVCAGEMPDNAHPEAKAAVAIAARTFLARAMRDHPTLGISSPVVNGPAFQVMARAAGAGCREASARTRGRVMTHAGRLILANHCAGALWTDDGAPGKDPTGTERFVTYNQGRRGDAVIPTSLALRSHPGNRGCMSQNGANWLGTHGFHHMAILRFFYGADIEIKTLETPTEAVQPAFSGPLGTIVLAAFGLLLKEAVR